MNWSRRLGDHAGAPEVLQGEDVQPRWEAYSGGDQVLHGEAPRDVVASSRTRSRLVFDCTSSLMYCGRNWHHLGADSSLRKMGALLGIVVGKELSGDILDQEVLRVFCADCEP